MSVEPISMQINFKHLGRKTSFQSK